MNDTRPAIVFDTGPLRHFTLQGWLGVLKYLTRDQRVVIPEVVLHELETQRADLPALQQVLDAEWITVDRMETVELLAAHARYEERLVVGTKNRGECGVLALGEVNRWVVVLDDDVAWTIATEAGLQVRNTLGLLCEGIREQKLTVDMVEHLADDLLSGTYYLPFSTGGFRRWALEEGLIDYS